MFLFSLWPALLALNFGWRAFAVFIVAGNVLVNVYPIMLQRYTRARIEKLREIKTRRAVQNK